MPIVDDLEVKRTSPDDSLESWVMDKVDSWDDNYNANYRDKHDSSEAFGPSQTPPEALREAASYHQPYNRL